MTRDQFYAILSRAISWLTDMPWDSISWGGFVHLGLFVHRITGLEPGLYVLIRNELKRDSLKERMAPGFLWQKPPEVPDGLALYFLRGDDVKLLASQVSCHQAIAGESAFSLGMLAEFEPAISHYGAHFYRNLFWETGMVGQVLYLEAEAFGNRSTGIGCFFDDPMHEAFGLRSRDYQSLYHFTIGGPVQDARLTTLPAYFHLSQK
jgi:nitroreductase